MATLNMNLREIRQTVYGRDMRKPIADGILHVGIEMISRYDREFNEVQRPELQRLEEKLQRSITSYSLTNLHDDYYTLTLTRVNHQ